MSRRTGAARAVAGLLLLVGLQLPSSERSLHTSCRVLPNGAVGYVAAAWPDCPLHAYERIEGVGIAGSWEPVFGRAELVAAVASASSLELRVSDGRGSRVVRLDTTSVGGSVEASLVLAFLGVLVGGAWAASRLHAIGIPLVAMTCSVLLQIFGRAAAIDAPLGDLAHLGSQALLPAALWHLALVFPRDHAIVRRGGSLAAAPYLVAGALAVSEGVLIHQQDRLWELVDRLFVASIPLSVVWLGASSYVAFRESESRLERAMARTIVAVAAVACGLLLVASIGAGRSLPVAPRRTLAVTTAALLGLLSYVGTRHASLDAPAVGRWVASYVPYTAIVASLALLFSFLARTHWGWSFPQPDPFVFVSTIFVLLLGVEQLRRATDWLSQAWIEPGAPRLDALRARASQAFAAATHPDTIMEVLLEGIGEGLRGRRGAGFLRLGDGSWRLAAAIGTARSFSSELAQTAEGLFEEESDGREDPVVLEVRRIIGQRRQPLRQLRRGDVEIVCLARSDGQARGLILLGGLGSHGDLSSDQREFARLLCGQAGLAIERAEVALDLLTATRMAAIGHAASGLAHDLGRPLGEISLGARRGRGVAEDFPTIHALAEECIELLDRFVQESKSGPTVAEGAAALGLIVEAAADRIARLESGRRPALRLAPRLPTMEDARNLQRLLENLIENAMYWSPADEPVEVSATCDGDEAIVRVRDRGVGLSPAERGRAFEPFYSTRSGHGLGLAICRDIATRLGGSVELLPAPDRGTVAVVRLPIRGA